MNKGHTILRTSWTIENKKNVNRPISITLHKAQDQVDQIPQNKTRHAEPDGRESEQYP